MIITQRGRGAAVLLGVAAFEALIDELGLLRDVRASERQAAAGRFEEREAVEARLRARLGR